ncbi:cobalamin B12-binding domain-containing protein [Actinomadura flavalba]|uniref:cobalamin B12-binding domain-containing protein n=1 Tax=Actinomadura flavalba TaxID=1120938 RepID=UPI0003785557|nr:cobalamin-dependent protein [Actinomadura flavalba]
MTVPSVVAPADVEACADRLFADAVEGAEHAAVDGVLAAYDAGVDAETLLLDVVARVQARVGAEWAGNRLTVAQEHTATAVNDRVVAALAHHPPNRAATAALPALGRVTVACVDGEWHALPARLLAEVLRLRGWHVDYLGAQVPTAHLISHVHRTGPAAVALSGSIPTRLPTAHAVITACQATGTAVLVGGAAFGPDGRFATLLGADAWAPDARAAAGVLAARPVPRPTPAPGLPHLGDQEYTMVARSSRQLVRETLHGLEERYPAMRAYTDRQRRHTAEDIAHIVDFLATALYVDDAELFTGFLGWTAGILAARNVPGRSLLPAVHVLAQRLRDFPRASALLEHGRNHLDESLPHP